MSNADLIKRLLHKASCNAGFDEGAEYAEIADALAAADKRMAELEAERDEWQRGEGCATKAWGEAERKLAVAVDALKTVVIMPKSHEAHRRATQALAQIGGEDHG